MWSVLWRHTGFESRIVQIMCTWTRQVTLMFWSHACGEICAFLSFVVVLQRGMVLISCTQSEHCVCGQDATPKTYEEKVGYALKNLQGMLIDSITSQRTPRGVLMREGKVITFDDVQQAYCVLWKSAAEPEQNFTDDLSLSTLMPLVDSKYQRIGQAIEGMQAKIAEHAAAAPVERTLPRQSSVEKQSKNSRKRSAEEDMPDSKSPMSNKKPRQHKPAQGTHKTPDNSPEASGSSKRPSTSTPRASNGKFTGSGSGPAWPPVADQFKKKKKRSLHVPSSSSLPPPTPLSPDSMERHDYQTLHKTMNLDTIRVMPMFGSHSDPSPLAAYVGLTSDNHFEFHTGPKQPNIMATRANVSLYVCCGGV